MNETLKQLVDETIELTGASPPSLFDDDAPVLRDRSDGVYLIGLVGGKDVGKSSMVNALVGKPITVPTSYGPGTEKVVAYAHESAVAAIRPILQSDVPDRFSILTHRIDALSQQVLLDLPDIDSKYGDHVQTTRRMLRHMLYPLWIQSVEKYADLRPQELLAAVAEGNDPANFIFCLNKADQLKPSEAQELRDDFARRVARVTGLETPPKVYLVSGQHPDRFDLPALKQLLSQQRSVATVEQSRALANRRQDRSLLGWVHQQHLQQHVERMKHLENDAEEMIAARLAPLLIDQAIPRLMSDPGRRMAMFEPVLRLRLSRWPIVNALDAVLSPVLALAQKNLSSTARGAEDPDAYLDRPGGLVPTIQAAFAQVHQLHPELSQVYGERSPWESIAAEQSAARLRAKFAQTLQRQRDSLVDHAGGRWPLLLAPIRWLLTIGALLWFPLVQPVAQVLAQETGWGTTREVIRFVVQMLSVAHLAQSAIFLAIWFVGLWILLRFDAQQKVAQLLKRWQASEIDEELSLSRQTARWMEELLEPIRERRQQFQSLVDRADELREQLTGPGPSLRELEPVRSRA